MLAGTGTLATLEPVAASGDASGGGRVPGALGDQREAGRDLLSLFIAITILCATLHPLLLDPLFERSLSGTLTLSVIQSSI